MRSTFYSKLEDLAAETTSHNKGLKRIFLSGTDTLTALTQFAHGQLAADDSIELHVHPSMEEFYYFLSGEGHFQIEENSYDVGEGVFIRVPHNTKHALKNTGQHALQFIYFGIAT